MQLNEGPLERRDAVVAARRSRNRTEKPDRKIEDRKMGFLCIFLSSIFLSLCVPDQNIGVIRRHYHPRHLVAWLLISPGCDEWA
jgi:hypothetical protein